MLAPGATTKRYLERAVGLDDIENSRVKVRAAIRFDGVRRPLLTLRKEKLYREDTAVADVGRGKYDCGAMQPLKARVHNGRLVLDEPTDLPEGEEVELVAINDVLAHGGDDLDDEERAALHAELRASMAEAKAGQLIDADDVLNELRAAR